MKRQSKAPDPDKMIESVPFIVRDIAQSKTSLVNMNDRGYWTLVGNDFMRYFSVNQVGESKRYQWETRHVDQLCNLWIWRKH